MTSNGGTSRYTDEEWTAIISQAEQKVSSALKSNDGNFKKPSPAIGSVDFNKTIDHTLLKLDSKSAQFDTICAEARNDQFATVCVRPPWVKQCVTNLKGSGIEVASVVGFHEGTYDLLHKVQETKESVEAGAGELDVVINYPLLKTGKDYSTIYNELATLRAQAPHPVLLKLILETSQLEQHHIIAGCVLAAVANFDFVKTSTGFNGRGATIEDVRLMSACCDYLAPTNADGPGVQRKTVMRVKASGGIRTLQDAVNMLEAGASRLGTSGGVWIAKEARESVERNGGVPPETEDVGSARPGMSTRLFTDY